MTNKKFLAGILGILLVFNFVLVSCDHGNGGDPKPKVLKITGMGDAGTGGFIVGLFSTIPDEGEPVTEINGFGVSSNGEVTIELKAGDPQTGQVWTGTGSYFVNAIDTTEGGLIYLYTNGAAIIDGNYSVLTKINFSDTVTTVSLDKFASAVNDLGE
jgi:hypothetical protein